jgi:hypothetical protein
MDSSTWRFWSFIWAAELGFWRICARLRSSSKNFHPQTRRIVRSLAHNLNRKLALWKVANNDSILPFIFIIISIQACSLRWWTVHWHWKSWQTQVLFAFVVFYSKSSTTSRPLVLMFCLTRLTACFSAPEKPKYMIINNGSSSIDSLQKWEVSHVCPDFWVGQWFGKRDR